MHPFYVIRLLGGLLFLTGALIMVYNLWRTVRGRTTEARAPSPCSARPSPWREE